MKLNELTNLIDIRIRKILKEETLEDTLEGYFDVLKEVEKKLRTKDNIIEKFRQLIKKHYTEINVKGGKLVMTYDPSNLPTYKIKFEDGTSYAPEEKLKCGYYEGWEDLVDTAYKLLDKFIPKYLHYIS